jgi:TonB family protein
MLLSTPAVRSLACLAITALLGCASNVPSDGFRASEDMPPQALGDAHVQANARGVVAPRRISGSAPIYPVNSLMRGGTGEALIEFTVTETGETADFVVVRATSDSFAAHSIAALQTWRFEPARRDGRAIAIRAQQPFAYRIR